MVENMKTIERDLTFKFIANRSNDTKYSIFYLPSDLERYKVKVRRDNKFSSKQDIEL